MEGKSQEAAAAAAGMSERSARTWRKGPLPSEKKDKRRKRTKPDPFAGVWDEDIVPLLQTDVGGILAAPTILEWLEERHPGRFGRSHLRTLQRRMRDWRALNGPDREVYFEQKHPPGREAQMDFTHCDSLKQLSEKSIDYPAVLILRSHQVERCFSMELRITSNFRMQAVRASFFGLPAASSR